MKTKSDDGKYFPIPKFLFISLTTILRFVIAGSMVIPAAVSISPECRLPDVAGPYPGSILPVKESMIRSKKRWRKRNHPTGFFGRKEPIMLICPELICND